MVRQYEPKALLMTVLLAVALPASVVWGAADGEQTDVAGAAASLGSTGEEAEFEANIKSLVSERQRLEDAKARLAAMKQRFERSAKGKRKPEKVEEPEPELAAPVEPKQKPAGAASTGNAIEIPLALGDAKSLMCLASSLYGLGHYEKALRCYEQVDGAKLTDDDAAWLSFQKGNCHFFTGEFEKCEKAMADVTSKHSESIWSRHAAAVIKDLHFWQQREAIIKAAEQSAQTSEAQPSSP